jgi:hypothetical protein
VNNAGILPLQIDKFAKGCDHTSEADIWSALRELSIADFAYFDEDTWEVFIRSYIRNDGVLKQPNIVKNALRCAKTIESAFLRSAMAIELRRLDRVDAVECAEVLDPSGTASEDFKEAHARLTEPFANPSETLPESMPENERVSEPLSNPAGRGRGRGEPNGGCNSGSTDKTRERKKPAPDKPDAAKAPEQIATANAYERVGKAFRYVAVLQIAKWAIHTRGEEPQAVEDALVALYEMGKPITKQLVGQYFDGHLGRSPNAREPAKGDQKVAGWLEAGGFAPSNSNSKEIMR